MKGEPFVQVMLDDKVITQFTPAEARQHGLAYLEAAEAAESDAFIQHYYKTEMDLGLEVIWPIIKKFREYREAQGKSGPPSRKADFMVTDKHACKRYLEHLNTGRCSICGRPPDKHQA